MTGYSGRVMRAGRGWAWVIEDCGCVVMRGGGCETEADARAAMAVELDWLGGWGQ